MAVQLATLTAGTGGAQLVEGGACRDERRGATALLLEGERLPASYANFYVANAGVLVPVFNDPRDKDALDIIGAQFPDRPALPVYARDLVLGTGTLHCLSQQQPR